MKNISQPAELDRLDEDRHYLQKKQVELFYAIEFFYNFLLFEMLLP